MPAFFNSDNMAGIFSPPSKPKSSLGWHRTLSPTAGIKVSPIILGGISIAAGWNSMFGKTGNPYELLDTFFDLGGNFIDTANIYNNEESEKLIGEWMQKRGVRDQMVIATKYSAQYRTHNRENEPFQANFTGNSAKSMHVSVRDSLKKLKTDYIDILYVHWWDGSTSVQEMMSHLHAFVMAGKVLYLGASDMPAWVVVKANEYARSKGFTPFSVYQGRWNAEYRDMEAEIVPMCEDQGMAIVSWASLGGGKLASSEQREKAKDDPNAPPGFYGETNIAICDAIEKIANDRKTTFQAVALAYLFYQSLYVFPIVGVQTVDHIKAIPDALKVKLTKEEVISIQDAAPFNPLFPNTFLFPGGDGKGYRVFERDATHHSHWKVTAWLNEPPRQPGYEPNS